MLTYHNDHTIKFSHTPVINKIGFQVNQIGPDDPYVFPTVDYTDTDANTIYVDSDTGDNGNAGTAAAPKETLLAAINATTATKTKVVALNTAIYNEDISGGTYTYFQGVYNDGTQASSWVGRLLGYTPADANSIFVAKTGDDGDAGTQAEPKLTIAGAIAACDGTHQAVVIMDSETYEEEGFEFTGDFTGLYAAVGEAPVVKPTFTYDQLNAADIYQAKDTVQFEANYVRKPNIGVFSDDGFVLSYTDVTNTDGRFIIYDKEGTVVVPEQSTGTYSTAYGKIVVFTDDSWLYCYTDLDDANTCKFKIYDSVGNVILAPVTVPNNLGSYTALLSNGNFVLVYVDPSRANKLYFIIYNTSGTVVVAETQISADDIYNAYLSSFDSGGFVVVYNNNTDSLHGKFKTYDNDGGAVVGETEFRAATLSGWTMAETLSNDYFIITSYSGVGGGSKYQIYDKAGSVIKAATDLTVDCQISMGRIHGTNWFIVGQDQGDSSKGKYAIYDCDGNEITAAATFETGEFGEVDGFAKSLDSCIGTQSNNNLVVAWDVHNSVGKYSIFYPYSWNAFETSVSSKINGIEINFNNLIKLKNGFKGAASINIVNCKIYNIAESSYGHLHGYAISSDSHVDITFSKIHDCDIGVDTTEATSDFYDSQFYRINEGYAIDVTGDGSINIEHCDIFDCYGGIRLQSNDGGEVIKNNIIHDCDTYAIYCDTAVTFTNSVYTDAVSGATVGASVVKANPLYINQGYTNPDDTDLNIKTKVLGYPADSPAKDLADDSRNAGSIDIEYIGTETDWTTITVAKPFLIDVGKEYAGAVNTQRKDGSYSSYKDGQSEVVEMTWKGITNAQYTLLEALWLSESSTVRIYPDPVTYPSSYEVYTLLRKDLDDKVNYWQLARTGRQNVKLSFARACE